MDLPVVGKRKDRRKKEAKTVFQEMVGGRNSEHLVLTQPPCSSPRSFTVPLVRGMEGEAGNPGLHLS